MLQINILFKDYFLIESGQVYFLERQLNVEIIFARNWLCTIYPVPTELQYDSMSVWLN